ncbi:GIY-YIG nuclease family protein [Candidatus Omnitrophota bacterium]
MYIVYILRSLKDSSRHYVGITQDLNKRLDAHNQSKSGYTKKYAPWHVETFITFNKKQLATQFEKYLKSGSGHTFLKRRLLP